MRTFSTYRNILKKKGWRYCLQEAWRKVQRVHYLSDDKLLGMQWANIVYHQLRQKYAHFQSSWQPIPEDIVNPYPDKIWVCWFQGEKQAPPIVHQCIASIRKYAGNREVIVLTEENISQYVTFPEFIIKKKEKGIMTNAHYSDILRLYLLAQYGGIWIDATVYLTASLPQYVTHNPLFFFKSSPYGIGKLKCSNWFIAADRNNEIIVCTLNMLLDYWKRNNYLKHYFIFHLLLAVAVDTKPQLCTQWKAIPYFDSMIPHTLLSELTDPYTPERWEQIKALSPIHKLTWKINPEHFARPGTFLQMILNSD